MKKFSQSFFDNLLLYMPELKNEIKMAKEYIDPNAAHTLYNVWRNAPKTSNGVYRRPTTMSMDEVNKMAKEGLVKTMGSEIQLTDKGQKVIKVMILGDDKSIFEDDGVVIDYNNALANTKNIKTANRKHKFASKSDWWARFEKNAQAEKIETTKANMNGIFVTVEFIYSKGVLDKNNKALVPEEIQIINAVDMNGNQIDEDTIYANHDILEEQCWSSMHKEEL
jgi:hypothetical protein